MKKVLSVALASLMVLALIPGALLGVSASDRTILPTLTPEQDGRSYLLYQNFDDLGVASGTDAVFEALGLTLPTNTVLQRYHTANVSATEGGDDEIYLYQLRDGKLYLRNRGANNETVLFPRTEALTAALKGAYTVEYTMTYLPTTTQADGYLGLLWAFDSATPSYGTACVRISGYGNNFGTFNDVVFDSGDASKKYTTDLCSSTSYMINNRVNPTLYERVFGNLDTYPVESNNYDLRGSKILAEKELHIKLEFDGTHGPAMYVNGVQVSAPVDTNAAKNAYATLVSKEDIGIGLLLTPHTECTVDDIMVYTTAVEEDEGNETQSSLYLTEICMFPGDSNARYIEIYNNGTETVDLADYGIALTKTVSGTWKTATPSYNNYVRFSDYIGKTLTFGTGTAQTVLENPASVTLAPGGCAVIYFATAAASTETEPHIAAKVGEVCMKGFRDLYHLSADLPVLGIPTESATDAAGEPVKAANGKLDFTNPTTSYNFSLVQAKNSEGEAIAWFEQSPVNEEMDLYIETRVDYLPFLVSGYVTKLDDTTFTYSTKQYADGSYIPLYYFGADGIPMDEYAAQYLYAANAAENYNIGTMISRARGTVASENSVGSILPVQRSYFEKLTARRTNGYSEAGGLVITELVPRTGNLSGTGDKDAFEAFEITNNSSLTLDLYQYGLVSSGNSPYGGIANWSRTTLFEATPRTGSAAEDAALARYTNPAELSLAPGASAVVWLFREDTVSAGALDGNGIDGEVKYYTIEDFRTYHGIAAEANVIVAASFDSVGGVIAENELTVSYGVATAESIRSYRTESTPITAAVSDVTVPMSLLYFDPYVKQIDFAEVMAVNPVIASYMIHYYKGSATKATLASGASLEGYYTRTSTGHVSVSTSPKNQTEIYIYTPCAADAVAVEGGEYYTVTAPTTKVHGAFINTAVPAGQSIRFAYGEVATDASTSGAIAGILTFSKLSMTRRVPAAGVNEIVTLKTSSAQMVFGSSNAFSFPSLNADYTLGDAQQTNACTVTWEDEAGNVTSTVTFDPNSCRGTYTILPDTFAHWLVNGEPYNAGERVALTGSTVIKPSVAPMNAFSVSLRVTEAAEDSGLRFTTAVSKELYAQLVATYGKENVKLMTAIAPASYFDEAEAHTVTALDNLSHRTNYVTVRADGFYGENDTELIFAGSLVDIQDAQMEFAAIGYLEVDTGSGIERYYGSTASLSRAVGMVARVELENLSVAQTERYCYRTEEELFSPYSVKEREILAQLSSI